MDPICFHIAGHPVYWYGIMMALAFLAAIGHWQWLGRRTGQNANLAGDLAFWLMVGGILGARLAYVAANLDYYRAAPQEILRIDQGGLIYYGGFLGGLLTFFIFARWRRLAALNLIDFTVTALPLGHAIGRIGCFLNGCCGGCQAAHPSALTGGLAHYPVQIYEALFNLSLYALLTWFHLFRRNARYGATLALYLIIYPVFRFLVEFIRGDARMRIGMLDVAQEISLLMLAAGLLLWWVSNRRHENTSCHT
jgi:phosphatidylglycerol:prolipoprotein diacylglycerol transferase